MGERRHGLCCIEEGSYISWFLKGRYKTAIRKCEGVIGQAREKGTGEDTMLPISLQNVLTTFLCSHSST
ncbi:unnamed protein product [Calypogeia fissa]